MDMRSLSLTKESPKGKEPHRTPCQQLASVFSGRTFRPEYSFMYSVEHPIEDWRCQPNSEEPKGGASASFTYANWRQPPEDSVVFDGVKECREGVELYKDGKVVKSFHSTCDTCDKIAGVFRDSAWGDRPVLRSPGGQFMQLEQDAYSGAPDCRERNGKAVFYPRTRSVLYDLSSTDGGHGLETVIRTGGGPQGRECVSEIEVKSLAHANRVNGMQPKKSVVRLRDHKKGEWTLMGGQYAREVYPDKLAKDSTWRD